MSNEDGQPIVDMFGKFGVRVIRGLIFWAAFFFLSLCLPYEYPSSFFISMGIGLLASVNMGARAAAVAIFLIFALAVLPPQFLAAIH
ncbi:hypothetical protein [Rhizobium sp. 11515TR]|uniref:hypothetical protein n=1 Tax=Rhizobium sp. 11515TR TaxID=2028343 RepID=UPI000BA8A76B|nr:hypothetical protein [Rhizobium sp. 11515TR]ASW04840.1 hypothetical protein CKA34_02280 [Rhizobium sp. 11515TR]